MSKRTHSSVTVDRRRFLSATAASTLALGGLSTTAAGQSNDDKQVVIKQDGKCISLKPLSYEGLPVKQLYDYRTPDTNPSSFKYASFGTRNLQRKNTSIMFLYDGPKGLSLVLVHGKLDSTGPGGAATFRITGLPAKGKWVVKDDSYDGSTNRDTFDHSINRDFNGNKSGTSVINWTWQEGRSDGGVYRGLGDEFKFKIHPAFNKKAALSQPVDGGSYEGKVDKWEVLSGSVNNPSRTELKMNKPVTIQTGGCSGSKSSTSSTTSTDPSDQNTGGTSSPTSSTTTAAPSGESKGFFQKIWDGLGAALNAVLSFFGNLF